MASTLTDDGFPVEFAWSSRDAAIRWTAEVGAPELPEEARLAAANALIEALGGSATGLAHAASPTPLRFGAWLGGRHTEDGSRYKLYIERPVIDAVDAAALCDLEQAISKRIEWRMVGVDTAARSCEYYGRVGNPGPAEIGLALDWARIDARADLMATVEALAPKRASDLPFGRSAGISVTLMEARPIALSWFAFARAIAPTPAAAAAAIRAAARAGEGDCRLLTALIGDADAPLGRIGMIGTGAASDGRCWTQMAWRPEALGSLGRARQSGF
ncbi:MAG: hypothetical protein ABIS51_12990 [Sphingomonas sp.]